MTAQTILLEGKPYVVLPRDEYDRLTTLAKAGELPPIPQPDAQGNYPAVGVRPRQLGPQDHPRPRRGGIESTRFGVAGRRARGNALPDRNRQAYPQRADHRQTRPRAEASGQGAASRQAAQTLGTGEQIRPSFAGSQSPAGRDDRRAVGRRRFHEPGVKIGTTGLEIATAAGQFDLFGRA